MTSSHKRQSFGINIGTTSILIIFVTLCLVCFAALSISSANADYTLSQKIASRTTAYYDACNQAQEKLAELQENLFVSYEYSSSAEEYYDFNGTETSFTIPISDMQSLEVILTICYPSDNTGALYEISSWKVITTGSYEAIDTLPLEQF